MDGRPAGPEGRLRRRGLGFAPGGADRAGLCQHRSRKDVGAESGVAAWAERRRLLAEVPISLRRKIL